MLPRSVVRVQERKAWRACVAVIKTGAPGVRVVRKLRDSFSLHEAGDSCCLMTRDTAPSGSFFIRFQASILDMDVTSQPLTDMI